MKTKQMVVTIVIFLGMICAQDALAFYNSSTGRWLSRDPVEEQGGTPLYAFAFNDPHKYQDLFGLKVFAVGITLKSWIAKPVDFGYVPYGNQSALNAAGKIVEALTSDSVRDDRIDGKYRFLSQKVISVECDGSTLKTSHSSPIITDVGNEGAWFMVPPEAIVTYDRSAGSSSAFYFAWKVKARPKPIAETTTFTPVRDRHGAVYIWHRVAGSVKCKCGQPEISFFDLSSSQFPSADLFFRIDGGPPLPKWHSYQAAMSELWEPNRYGPTLVK